MNSTYSTSVAGNGAATISDWESNTAYNYCLTGTSVLLMWHYLITFDKEFTFFWKPRLSGASVLFFVNRYLTLGVVLYSGPWWTLRYSHLGCVASLYMEFITRYSQYVVWAVFSCLRVYALQRRWRWAAVVFVLSLAIVVDDLLLLRYFHISSDSSTGQCNPWYDIPLFLRNSLTVVSRVSLITAEIIVMIVTWTKMRHHASKADIPWMSGRAVTLSTVFYNNGRIYFVLTSLLHVLNLAFSLLPLKLANHPVLLECLNLVVLVTEPLIGILVNHTLLELCEAAGRNVYLSEGSLPDVRSVDSDSDSDAGEVSLLQFVRADVDTWIHWSEGDRSTMAM